MSMDTYVVAEIGPNHAGSYERAEELVRVAAAAGADGAKLQIYEASHLAMNSDLTCHSLPDDGGPWAGRKLYDLYAEGATPLEWYPRLKAVGDEHGIEVFASVFHPSTVVQLQRYDCPRYKVASAEVEDPTLLRALRDVGVPVVLSDGVASSLQVANAINIVRGAVTVLHCVSGYPAEPGAYDIDRMRRWSMLAQYGLSDHTLGSALAVVAVASGATMVEKHLMLDPADYEAPPLDAGHSITPDQFATYVAAVREAEQLADVPTTMPAVNSWRRRVVLARDMRDRQVVREGDVRTARCAEGIPAVAIDDVLGRRVQHEMAKGAPMREEDLEQPH